MVAKFDMAVHNPATHEDLLGLDEVELYKDLFEQFAFCRFPEPGYHHVLFSHLVSTMDAGYYSYIWYVIIFNHEPANKRQFQCICRRNVPEDVCERSPEQGGLGEL